MVIWASGMSLNGTLTGFNIQEFSAKNALNSRACCKVLWFGPVLLQDSDATGCLYAHRQHTNIDGKKRKDLRLWKLVCGEANSPHPENCTCCLFWPQHSFSPKRTKTRRNLIFTNIWSAWVLHKNVQFPSPPGCRVSVLRRCSFLRGGQWVCNNGVFPSGYKRDKTKNRPLVVFL